MSNPKLEIFNLKEDPDRWEALIKDEIEASVTNPNAKLVVESMYWEEDRKLAFQRFLESLDFQCTLEILSTFKVSRRKSICEIGGGSGQLSWALTHSGFEKMELLEPNSRWITGTGYLQTVLDQCGGRLQLCNDLTVWYASKALYQTVITRNCVHHFPNIAMTAASIRQKLKEGGLWVMIREWYAETPAELYGNLRGHPYCQKYQVYEFPFPPWHYAHCLEFAGFKLIGVVPTGYANNALGAYMNEGGSKWRRKRTRLQRSVLKRAPWLTVFWFQLQNFLSRSFGIRVGSYRRPQIMIFQKVDV